MDIIFIEERKHENVQAMKIELEAAKIFQLRSAKS
jgi:hypothetical protein